MRRKYHKLMIRTISLICSFVVIFSAFTIPAFAATEDNFIDFLVYDEYLFSSGTSYDTPSSYYYGTACNFTFGLDSSWYSCSEVVIGIDTQSESIIPQKVTVSFKNSGAKDFTYLYSSGSIHYFSYTGFFKFTDSFVVRIFFSSIYNGVVSISSFYGVKDSIYTAFDSVHAKITGMLYEAEDQSYYRQTFVNETASLPYESSLNSSDMPAIPANVQLYDFFTFDFGVPYAESFQMTFISTGVFTNYYDSEHLTIFGCTLNSSSGAVNIPYTVASSMMDSTWYGDPVWRHTIYVDLSGLDLSDSSLTCSVLVEGIYQNEYNDNWFIRIENAGYFQTVYEDNFFSRIRSFFLRCFTSIESKIDSIISAIQDNSVKGSLDEAGESLGDTIDKAADQELTVNESVAKLQADWTAEHANLSQGFETTLNRSNNAIEFLSDYAQRIYDNIGWFGSVYSAVGMMSVLMLILSKSGLAHKVSSSVRSGPHTGSNGGIK